MKRLLSVLEVFVIMTAASGYETDVRGWVGESVTLKCKPTSDVDTVWTYRRQRRGQSVNIYSNHEIAERYRTRYAVNSSNTDGNVYLTILHARLNDSGVYSCNEGQGFLHEYVTRVLILEIKAEVTVCTGQTVTLSCHTTMDTDVDWKYRTHLNGHAEFIYYNLRVDDRYREKFTVNSSVNGTYSLVLSNVRPYDSGLYSCIEDGGLGEEHVNKVVISELCESGTFTRGASSAVLLTVGLVVGSTVTALIALAVLLFWCKRRLRCWAQNRSSASHNNKNARQQQEGGRVSSDVELQPLATTQPPQSEQPADSGEMTAKLTETRNEVEREKGRAENSERKLAEVTKLLDEEKERGDVNERRLNGQLEKEKERGDLNERKFNEVNRELEEEKRKLNEMIKQREEEQERERRVLHTLPDGEPIYGITQLENKLCLLRSKPSDQLELYNVNSYLLKRCLTVPGLQSSEDLASCEHHRCLYVSDRKAECVHRLDLHGKATRWAVYDKPYGLSITAACNLLVTCYQVRRLKEFSTRGDVVRQIDLQSDAVSPFQSLQLAQGQYVLCHGDTSDPVNRVCTVDAEGRTRLAYGDKRGSAAGQLKGPVHLAVGSEQFIFVADAGNWRVLVLNPGLEFDRVALSREKGLKWLPWRLTVDRYRRRLYVADNEQKFTAGRLIVLGF